MVVLNRHFSVTVPRNCFGFNTASAVGEPSRMKLVGCSNKSLPAICCSFFLTWSEVVNYRSLRGVSVLVRLINFGTGDRDGHYQNPLTRTDNSRLQDHARMLAASGTTAGARKGDDQTNTRDTPSGCGDERTTEVLA